MYRWSVVEKPEVGHILCPGGLEEEEGSCKGSSEEDEFDNTSTGLRLLRLRWIRLRNGGFSTGLATWYGSWHC